MPRKKMPRRQGQRAPVKLRLPNGMILKTDGFGGVSWGFDEEREDKEPRYKLVEVIGMTESYRQELEQRHRTWRKAVKAFLHDAYRKNVNDGLNPLRAPMRRPDEIIEP